MLRSRRQGRRSWGRKCCEEFISARSRKFVKVVDAESLAEKGDGVLKTEKRVVSHLRIFLNVHHGGDGDTEI